MTRKLQILRGTTAQNDAYTGSIGELTMDTEKVEVRIHDGTTQGGKTIGSGGGASLPILMAMWSDHVINDMSWLRADTFSWHSGDVYKAVYEHLTADFASVPGTQYYAWLRYGSQSYYTTVSSPDSGDKIYYKNASGDMIQIWMVLEGGSQTIYSVDGDELVRDSTKDEVVLQKQTDTIGDITITYYLAEDAHKICLPDQESNLIALYNATGVAWYYILDTENKQFKLPRTKYGFTGLRDSVGGYVAPGLPNITGTTHGCDDNSGSWSGAFYNAGSTTNTSGSSPGSYGGFDASLSNQIYGASNTVQPPATQMYLYFYVGNFEQTAVEQTAGLNAELFNGKADVSRVEVLEGYDYVVESQMPTADNGYTWYRKYKSGYVEQGVLELSFTTTAQTWTFVIPMADTHYVSMPVKQSDNGNNIIVYRNGTTACKYAAPSGSAQTGGIYISGMSAQ